MDSPYWNAIAAVEHDLSGAQHEGIATAKSAGRHQGRTPTAQLPGTTSVQVSPEAARSMYFANHSYAKIA